MSTDPLIHAWRFDADGAGRGLSWGEVGVTNIFSLGHFWLHLHHRSDDALAWIKGRSAIDECAVKALLAHETRPRYTRFQDGAVLMLRSVNENRGHDYHDMVALRMWVDDIGIVSLRGRPISFIDEIRGMFDYGSGPRSPGELLVLFLEHLTTRIGSTLERMDDQLEALEEYTLTEHDRFETRRDGPRIRQRLGDLRVAAVAMRRYLAPQREAIARLLADELPWVNDALRSRLAEVVNESTRQLEDLDEIRDTAGIIQDSVANAISEGLNDLLFKLTMMSAFFMPLSFVVGWFGSNVSGLFLNADSAWFATQQGFFVEGVLLVGIGLIEIWIFKRLKWL
ncbi:MAG: hypothetical protein HQL86_04780 [Magnetococcales bacterium]|nr:hypothetical protein [Magnetococcales bacterium]